MEMALVVVTVLEFLVAAQKMYFRAEKINLIDRIYVEFVMAQTRA